MHFDCFHENVTFANIEKDELIEIDDLKRLHRKLEETRELSETDVAAAETALGEAKTRKEEEKAAKKAAKKAVPKDDIKSLFLRCTYDKMYVCDFYLHSICYLSHNNEITAKGTGLHENHRVERYTQRCWGKQIFQI